MWHEAGAMGQPSGGALRSSIRGAIVRTAAFRGGVIADAVYPTGTFLPMHEHAVPYISVVTDGRYTEVSVKETRGCSVGTAIYHPAGETHADYFVQPGRCLNLELGSETIAALARNGVDIERRQTLCGEPLSRSLPLIFDQNRLEASDIADHLEETLLAALDGDGPAAGRVNASARWFQEAQHMLAGEDSAARSITGIAGAVGVHPVHLAREFQRRLRCTPTEYRLRQRVEAAARALRSKGATIAEVADMCGFADQAHLTRTFKRHCGMTPAAYAKRFRDIVTML